MPPVPGRRAPGSMSKINQRLSCRRKLGMPLALSFKKCVKELSKCLVLRGYRILDCPQFLCRFSLHCRLLSFQVGCIFPEESVQPVLSSSVLKAVSPHWLYANSSKLLSPLRSVAYVGGCCRPPLAGSAFACRRSRAVCAREYGKDQLVTRFPARQENYTTPRLQMASAGF